MTKEVEQIFGSRSSTTIPNSGGSGRPSPFTARRGSSRSPSFPSSTAEPPSQEQFVKLFTLFFKHFGYAVLPTVVLGLIAWVWSTVLLIIAVHKMQGISPIAACAVWFIMFAIGAAIVALIMFAFYSLVIAIISMVVQQSGGAGGISVH